MKKRMTAASTFALLATGIMLYSCQKTQLEQGVQSTESNYTAQLRNDLLTFTSVNDYTDIANDPDNKRREKFINQTYLYL